MQSTRGDFKGAGLDQRVWRGQRLAHRICIKGYNELDRPTGHLQRGATVGGSKVFDKGGTEVRRGGYPRCPAATVMGPWDRYCSAGTRCTCDLRRQTGGGKRRGGKQRNEMGGKWPAGRGGQNSDREGGSPPPLLLDFSTVQKKERNPSEGSVMVKPRWK